MDSALLSGVSFLLKLNLSTLTGIFLSSECDDDECPVELGGGEGFLNGRSTCARPGEGGGSYTGLCGVYPGLSGVYLGLCIDDLESSVYGGGGDCGESLVVLGALFS